MVNFAPFISNPAALAAIEQPTEKVVEVPEVVEAPQPEAPKEAELPKPTPAVKKPRKVPEKVVV